MSRYMSERSALSLRKTFVPGLLLVAFMVALAPSSFGGELAWIRQAPGCAPPGTTGNLYFSFECGDLGRFTFSDDPALLEFPAGSCAAGQEGFEVPEKYSSIPSLPPISGGQPLMPCDGGTCASSEIPAQGEWLAVIDWDDWHGRSVSWMIQSLSGVTPVLLDLGSGQPAGHTSDVHVLQQLCRIAEHNENNPNRQPAAVNMSFGRPAEEASYETCLDDEEDLPLSCMVVQALGLLEKSSPILAAAGNHDTLIFPASIDQVVAVGALDVAWFNHSDQVGASWQTPDLALDLMPGSSICIDDDRGEPWAAPPGTSWATAILSAWTVFADPKPAHWLAGRWQPMSFGTKYLLASDHGPVEGSDSDAFTKLFSRLRGASVWGDCVSGSEVSPGSIITLEAALLSGGLNAQPIILMNRQANQPTPDPDPCLPCTGGWDDGPGGGGLFGVQEAELEIDLSDSPGVPGDLELIGLRLVRNRGALFFDLNPQGTSPALFYQRLQSAEYLKLRIQGMAEAALPGDELSLVYLYQDAAAGSGGKGERAPVTYWSATPIQVPVEAGEGE